MSTKKPAKQTKLRPGGGGEDRRQVASSKMDSTPEKNSPLAEQSKTASGQPIDVEAILGEAALESWDGDGDVQFKASLRKNAGLPRTTKMDEAGWIPALARLRLKKLGITKDAADYEQRMTAEVKTIQSAREAVQRERAEDQAMRAECEKLGAELQMILDHCQKPARGSKSPVKLHQLKPFSQLKRKALLTRLRDHKRRPSLIDQRLRRLKIENPTDRERADARAYFDREAQWLKDTLAWSVKKLKARRAEVERHLRDLRGQIAINGLGLGSGSMLRADEISSRLFHYDLADEIAASESIKDEQPGHRNRPRQYMRACRTAAIDTATGEEMPDGDRCRLFILLRLLGESCASQENASWLIVAEKLHEKCRGDFDAFRSILDPLFMAFRFESSPHLEKPPGWKAGDPVEIPAKLFPAVARFVWRLTDSQKVSAEKTKRLLHQKKLDEWKKHCAAIRKQDPRAPLPPRPLTDEEREEEKRQLETEGNIRGWTSVEIAKALQERGLEDKDKDEERVAANLRLRRYRSQKRRKSSAA